MSIEAMKQALEALEHEADVGNDDAYRVERDALRQAIEQAEQAQPVAWYMRDSAQNADTAPQNQNGFPQRQPLTDEQIAKIASTPCAVAGSYVHTFARAIEAAHGIKD